MKKLYTNLFKIEFLKKLREKPLFSGLLSYEFLSYALFGVLTTVVNLETFYFSDKILGNASLVNFTLFSHPIHLTFEDVSTLFAWIMSVLFAFVTNKIWVFESKSRKALVVFKELASFVGTRVTSFVLFEFLGFMLVRNMLLNFNVFESENVTKWVAKFSIAIFVVLFNYVMSKLFTFRKKGENSDESQGN